MSIRRVAIICAAMTLAQGCFLGDLMRDHQFSRSEVELLAGAGPQLAAYTLIAQELPRLFSFAYGVPASSPVVIPSGLAPDLQEYSIAPPCVNDGSYREALTSYTLADGVLRSRLTVDANNCELQFVDAAAIMPLPARQDAQETGQPVESVLITGTLAVDFIGVRTDGLPPEQVDLETTLTWELRQPGVAPQMIQWYQLTASGRELGTRLEFTLTGSISRETQDSAMSTSFDSTTVVLIPQSDGSLSLSLNDGVRFAASFGDEDSNSCHLVSRSAALSTITPISIPPDGSLCDGSFDLLYDIEKYGITEEDTLANGILSRRSGRRQIDIDCQDALDGLRRCQ